jgi:formate hydrogenlyase subunit 3/multisubunit Na+/H+ antiporter MnhD subunit
MLLFIAGENLCLNYKTDLIEEVGGVISDKPLLGASIFIGLLSITSLPPFALFFSEARLIHNTFSVNNYFISFVLIIKNLLFSYIIFKKTSSVLYGNKKNPDEKRDMILGYSLIVILIFIIIICGLFLPTQLSKLFNNGAAIILGDL